MTWGDTLSAAMIGAAIGIALWLVTRPPIRVAPCCKFCGTQKHLVSMNAREHICQKCRQITFQVTQEF